MCYKTTNDSDALMFYQKSENGTVIQFDDVVSYMVDRRIRAYSFTDIAHL